MSQRAALTFSKRIGDGEVGLQRLQYKDGEADSRFQSYSFKRSSDIFVRLCLNQSLMCEHAGCVDAVTSRADLFDHKYSILLRCFYYSVLL